MFVVLKVQKTDKRTVKRGRTIHDVRLINTGAGQCFYEVTALSGERGVNWAEVAAFTGNHGRNLLLAEDEALPDGCPVARFDSAQFRNILIFNTTEVILKELFFMGARARCVVNDPDGIYCDYIRSVVKFSRHTTVITKNELRYFSAVRGIYTDMGAGVTLTDSMNEIPEDAVCIDTDGTIKGDGFTAFSPFSGFMPFAVEGDEGLGAFCPSYISRIDFLGAMYKMNSMQRLGSAVCRSFLNNGEPFTPYDIARLIKCGRNADITHSKSIIFYV